MRVISPDEFDSGIYEAIEQANDKVVLWQHPTGAVWAVVVTSTHEVPDVDSVATAFVLDKSERSDNSILKWVAQAAERAAHPEDEAP